MPLAAAMPSRIALYSPGMVGLGHIRRNLVVAQALAAGHPAPAILLIAEAREAGALPMPDGVDCVTLPALQKHADGVSTPRHLGLPLGSVVTVRSRIIDAALDAFEPDLVIVDHLPLGAHGELRPALERLRAGGRTRCVLGLRDILDSPDVVRDEWLNRGYDDAVEEHYDAVWVYGDPAVFDATREYDLPPQVTAKLRFAGYLDTRARLRCRGVDGDRLWASLGLPPGRLALCLVGGGVDGDQVAMAFVRADLPAGAHGVIVAGPFMPAGVRRRLHEASCLHGRMRVVDFVSEPVVLVRHADWIVTMGGYNSVCDALAFEKRALVVPRQSPRCEQRIRAERLQALGLVDTLAPGAATPAAIAAWLAGESAAGASRPFIDMNALARLPRFVADVFDDAGAGALAYASSLPAPEQHAQV